MANHLLPRHWMAWIKSWTEYHRVKKWYHIRGKNANHQAKAWKNHIIWEDECL